MSNLKYKLEALLFSSGRRMNLEELERLTQAPPEDIRQQIKGLIEEYKLRGSSIHIREEGNAWKLTVKDEHLDTVKQIVSKTELSKTLMETLAVIAFKYPIKQSDLIKIRTNKAYEHIAELEDLDYISRQKYGRTRLIKLAPKFFEYFDLSQDKLKESFQDFEGIAKAIEEKEGEIKDSKAKQKMQAESKINEKEIDLIDDKGPHQLKTYDKPQEELEKEQMQQVTPLQEHVGDLDVVDVPEPNPEEPEEESEGIQYADEVMGEEVVGSVKDMVEGEEDLESDDREEEAKTSNEIDSDVDKKVEELLKPQEEPEEAAPPEDQPEKIEELEEAQEETIEHTEPQKEPPDLKQEGEEDKEYTGEPKKEPSEQ